MAIARRKPSPGLVHHSDRGVQYTALSFGQRLEEAGIVPSMGSVGSAYENALAESFVATLKSELLYQGRWPTRQDARTAFLQSTSRASTTPGVGTQRWDRLARQSSRRLDYETRMLRDRNVSTEPGQVHPKRPIRVCVRVPVLSQYPSTQFRCCVQRVVYRVHLSDHGSSHPRCRGAHPTALSTSSIVIHRSA